MGWKFVWLLALVLMAQLTAAGVATTTSFQFEDLIDTWGPHNPGVPFVAQLHPLSSTHGINPAVDPSAGVQVTEAFPELDLTNGLTTAAGRAFCIRHDFREVATVALDGANRLYDLGEVDDSRYQMVLNSDRLTDKDLLDGDVTVRVSTNLDTATAFADQSRLIGTAENRTVPEPLTVLLIGFGLTALAGARLFARRRKA